MQRQVGIFRSAEEAGDAVRAAEELLAAGGDPWHGAPKKERQHKRGEVRCICTHPHSLNTRSCAVMLPLLLLRLLQAPPPAPKRALEEGQASKSEKRDPKKQLTSVPLPTSAADVANAGMAKFLFGQLG